MSVSVVIPHWPLTPSHDEALKKCVRSLGDCLEIIVVVNNGIGFAKACNQGIALTSGDHVAIINNDLFMNTPVDMDWFVEPGAVTFPVINGIEQEFHGSFLVIPREVIQGPLSGKVYDERFLTGFWEDVDLWERLKVQGVPFRQVAIDVTHPIPGFTMRHTPSDTDAKNKKLFFDKWGYIPEKNWQ